MSKHEFALYSPEVAYLISTNSLYDIKDSTLIHRIYHVLRLDQGDIFTLFDDTNHVRCSIVQCSKKKIRISVGVLQKNRSLKPAIHWLLPILEREAFEAAISSLAVTGATTIQPVITEKSRKKWGTQKDKDRIKRLIIAAAEQSKCFVMPVIHDPIMLNEALDGALGSGIYFDVSGGSVHGVLQKLSPFNEQIFTCLVGPEGDLTGSEKDCVREKEFAVCSLTPTVLRSWHAVLLANGILRSYFKCF